MRASTTMPSSMGRLCDFAVQVAAIQELGSMVQWELARVVGHNSAGVDDDALHSGAFPILAPPRDVVRRRIVLGDIGLAPPQRVSIPGARAGGSGGGGGRRECRLEKVASRHCPVNITHGGRQGELCCLDLLLPTTPLPFLHSGWEWPSDRPPRFGSTPSATVRRWLRASACAVPHLRRGLSSLPVVRESAGRSRR